MRRTRSVAGFNVFDPSSYGGAVSDVVTSVESAVNALEGDVSAAAQPLLEGVKKGKAFLSTVANETGVATAINLVPWQEIADYTEAAVSTVPVLGTACADIIATGEVLVEILESDSPLEDALRAAYAYAMASAPGAAAIRPIVDPIVDVLIRIAGGESPTAAVIHAALDEVPDAPKFGDVSPRSVCASLGQLVVTHLGISGSQPPALARDGTVMGQIAQQAQVNKIVSDANAGTLDVRDAMTELYALGRYAEGNKLRPVWRLSLVNSPTAAMLRAGKAINGTPAEMLRLASELDLSARDPFVLAYWKDHAWGLPTTEFAPLSAGLRQHAAAALAAAVKPVVVLKPVAMPAAAVDAGPSVVVYEWEEPSRSWQLLAEGGADVDVPGLVAKSTGPAPFGRWTYAWVGLRKGSSWNTQLVAPAEHSTFTVAGVEVGITGPYDVKALQDSTAAYRTALLVAIDSLLEQHRVPFPSTGIHSADAWDAMQLDALHWVSEDVSYVSPAAQYDRGRAIVARLDDWRAYLATFAPDVALPDPMAVPAPASGDLFGSMTGLAGLVLLLLLVKQVN